MKKVIVMFVGILAFAVGSFAQQGEFKLSPAVELGLPTGDAGDANAFDGDRHHDGHKDERGQHLRQGEPQRTSVECFRLCSFEFHSSAGSGPARCRSVPGRDRFPR